MRDDGRGSEIDVRGQSNVVIGGHNLGQVQVTAPAVVDPPPGKERRCPECKRVNWWHAKDCVHCRYGLFTHDLYWHHTRLMERYREQMIWATVAAVALMGGMVMFSNLKMASTANASGLLGFASLAFASWSSKHFEAHKTERAQL